MLVEDYEADGWLGLLLGTSMWYGFYGDALSSGSGFESRMDALCREIGGRGRADEFDAALGVVNPEPEPELEPELVSHEVFAVPGTLRHELDELRLKQLCQRAAAEGIDEDTVGDALNADNPKAALIALVVGHVSSRGPAEQLLATLGT